MESLSFILKTLTEIRGRHQPHDSASNQVKMSKKRKKKLLLDMQENSWDEVSELLHMQEGLCLQGVEKVEEVLIVIVEEVVD